MSPRMRELADRRRAAACAKAEYRNGLASDLGQELIAEFGAPAKPPRRRKDETLLQTLQRIAATDLLSGHVLGGGR